MKYKVIGHDWDDATDQEIEVSWVVEADRFDVRDHSAIFYKGRQATHAFQRFDRVEPVEN